MKDSYEGKTFCIGCECMTISIRKGRVNYVCDKCGYKKSLGDYYQDELILRLGVKK